MKRIISVIMAVVFIMTLGIFGIDVQAKNKKSLRTAKTQRLKKAKTKSKKTSVKSKSKNRKSSKKSTDKKISKKNKKKTKVSKKAKKLTVKTRKSLHRSKAAAVKKSSKKLAEKVPRHGEMLDWWKQARFLFPRGAVATVYDVRSGRSFKVKRTFGTNHADCEALTKGDTSKIKSIFGGFTWEPRPVIVKAGGKYIAASMSDMPHAGVDSAPVLRTVNNRSGGFMRGQNLDSVKKNGMNGHFDIHFLNSERHNDDQKDPRHQRCVRIASGR